MYRLKKKLEENFKSRISEDDKHFVNGRNYYLTLAHISSKSSEAETCSIYKALLWLAQH